MPHPVADAPRVVRFSVFELDVRTGELRKGGVRLNLPDQPLQILTALVERPNEIVTRDELRQRLWPSDTFVDFEHGLNAAVKRLRDVLGDVADSPRFVETVPRRGYRFVAPVERTANPTDVEPHRLSASSHAITDSRTPSLRSWWIAAGAATLVLVVAAATLVWLGQSSGERVQTPPMRVVPLTSLPGSETSPTFSPDGTEVAFTWTPERDDKSAIYVTGVGSSEVRRLTTSSGYDATASWSPDGRQIAFIRYRPGPPQESRIYVTSPLGGSDLRVSDLPARGPISWSPDGHFIAAARAWSASAAPGEPTGIYFVPGQGGEPRRITPTSVPAFDHAPAFSPDGQHLAYASCLGVGVGGCDVNIIDLNAELTPVHAPRRLTMQAFYFIETLTWSRDGKSVIYGSQGAYVMYLWRVAIDGDSSPERLDVAGLGASGAATVGTRDILAFSRFVHDVDVYRVAPGHAPESVIASTFADFQPQYSADGQRIVFLSERSGDSIEIWIAQADGSGAHRLVHGPSRWWQGSPHWSPDGHSIVFDSQGADGYWHVWTVDAEGGTPHQITKGLGHQNMPTWSRDGRWIYFSAERGGARNIWRVHADGDGSLEQLTRAGSGSFACESADGRSLLFQPEDNDSPLLSMSLGGGPVRQLVACAKVSAFAASPQGTYYVACDPGPDPTLHLIEPLAVRERIVATLDHYEHEAPPGGLAMAPDGKTILYSRNMTESANLMLIENFK